MFENLRIQLARALMPAPVLPQLDNSRTAQLAARFAVAVESFNLQQGASMQIHADLLRQLGEITALLSAASVRLAASEAATNQQIADATARVAELEAENQRLRDAAASGEAGSIEIAAAIAALAEAARKFGEPVEANP